jgi:hypothetical protein
MKPLIRRAWNMNSEFGIRGNDEERRFSARERVEDSMNNSQSIFRTFVGQPQKNDAAVRVAALEYEFTEILVFGHKYAAFALRLRHDGDVRYSSEILADPGHIMASAAQSIGRGTTDILVQKELQRFD